MRTDSGVPTHRVSRRLVSLVALFSLVAACGGDSEPLPLGSSTTNQAGATTTAGSTTTTLPGTLVSDDFEPGEPTTATPATLTHPELGDFVFGSDGRPVLTAHATGTIPVMYPVTAGRAEISFRFLLTRAGSGTSTLTGAGATVLSTEPDGLGESVAVLANLGADGLWYLTAWEDAGEIVGAITAPIPPEADYRDGEFNLMSLSLADGGFVASINGVPVLTWVGPSPSTTGYFGWMLYAGTVGDAMAVDDFVAVETPAPPPTTTMPPPVSTTVPTGTLVSDTFEPGAGSAATPFFGETRNTFTFGADGRPVLTSVATGLLPVLYPVTVGDATVSFRFHLDALTPTTWSGAVLFAQPGSAFLLVIAGVIHYAGPEFYVRLQWPTAGGGFTATDHVIPDEAGYDAAGFNEMGIAIAGGHFTVSINGTDVVTFTEPLLFTSGQVGWAMWAQEPGETMLVDDFVVIPAG